MKKMPEFVAMIMLILMSIGLIASSDNVSAANQNADAKEVTVRTITAKDGTKITYDQSGKGPAVILVGGALGTRSGHAELAQLLGSDFTVYNYDRRGRGDSTDTKPYSVAREIEDIEALINAAGGSGYVYGVSSGACLALQAAAALGAKVLKLAIYEAPYDEAAGAAEEWKKLRSQLDELLGADRRGEAVELFMKFVGTPDPVLAEMKASPAWSGMEAVAPTLTYDMMIVGENRSVPVARAAEIKTSTLVMDGGASLETMPFMRPTAEKIARAIPNAQRRTIEGQGHAVDAKVLAPILAGFFRSE